MSKGLGDDLEKLFKKTGIDKVAKFVLGEDCGCNERKEKLNKLFPHKKPECLTEGEYDYLTKYYDKYPNNNKGTRSAIILRQLYAINNRVFNENRKPSNCPTCVIQVLHNLKSVYVTYGE